MKHKIYTDTTQKMYNPILVSETPRNKIKWKDNFR